MDTKLYRNAAALVMCFCFSLGACEEERGDEAIEDTDDGGTVSQSCVDPQQVRIAEPIGLEGNPTLFGQIIIDELQEHSSLNDITRNGIIRAVFADVTEYEESQTSAVPFDASCVGILGRPDETTGLSLIEAGEIVINNPILGEMALKKDDNGRYIPRIEDEVFSPEGGETIQIDVSSFEELAAFPDFRATLIAPPPISNTFVEVNDDGGLSVEWESADSTYFEIVIRTESTSSDLPENRLRCFLLEDDGCYKIPISAVQWLRAQGAEVLKIRMERHMLTLMAPETKAMVEIDAIRSIEFTINVI